MTEKTVIVRVSREVVDKLRQYFPELTQESDGVLVRTALARVLLRGRTDGNGD